MLCILGFLGRIWSRVYIIALHRKGYTKGMQGHNGMEASWQGVFNFQKREKNSSFRTPKRKGGRGYQNQPFVLYYSSSIAFLHDRHRPQNPHHQQLITNSSLLSIRKPYSSLATISNPLSFDQSHEPTRSAASPTIPERQPNRHQAGPAASLAIRRVVRAVVLHTEPLVQP
ncbi:uncharacterized protein LY89DRAFT_55851 [Mollisia scopiformis]|uniref:Uncharacterized protein n=1 Tax=Mollisia scopiformis TaxID=149040 RepID=A0A194XBK7_MOLSC|nr:uncharacterized protein LY89DRAFT_55851 [Mollisia scopiformis]KUJ17546.1 hypothetical protein LY89DRAFT_55851 [Mollisia scopiformis]